MVSLGMLASRAAIIAERSRGLAFGSTSPVLAATVNSRMILVKTLARFLSCAPFRYMMFLNCEWPAISAASPHAPANKPIWQDCGEAGAKASAASRYRHIFGEPSADPHRLDAAGQPSVIV